MRSPSRSAMLTPPSACWSSPVRTYGQCFSFSPLRGFAPGDSGWTVATGSGLKAGAAVDVRVLTTVCVAVDGDGEPDDEHPLSNPATAAIAPTIAPAVHRTRL